MTAPPATPAPATCPRCHAPRPFFYLDTSAGAISWNCARCGHDLYLAPPSRKEAAHVAQD